MKFGYTLIQNGDFRKGISNPPPYTMLKLKCFAIVLNVNIRGSRHTSALTRNENGRWVLTWLQFLLLW